MTKAVPILTLDRPETRAIARAWVAKAERGTRLQFSPPRRSLDQNSKIHAACTDVALQVEWAGKKRGVESWKDIFTAALRSARHELDIVPGINGGFVLLGMHTSSMSKAEASDLIDLIHAFGAEHNVTFSDPQSANERRLDRV